MSKKREPSSNSAFPFDLKKGGVGVFILALLILAANALLSDRGGPLPADIVNQAEEIVSGALDPESTPREADEADAPPTRTPKPAPRATPIAPASDTEDMPWAEAEGDFDYYVLALSWQPAFCESKPEKEECETQTADRYDAANFVLHGLWPNLAGDDAHTFGYCEVSQTVIQQDEAGNWCEMPDLTLSDAVWQDLTERMPGTASCLHHHEWYKHGTCAGMSPDDYFTLTNALVERFAATDFNRYVSARVGDEVARRDLLAQFDAEFGPGARDYLSLRCTKVGGVSLLSEIQIALQPDLAALDDFAALFPDVAIPTQGNCPQTFSVDEVGTGGY